MNQRRVMITGAGGFVGGALALGFADLGWRVIGLDRAFDSGRAFDAEREDHGIHRVTAELAQGVPADISDVDLVVHAAWVTTEAGTVAITPAEHVALNLRPLLALLEFTARTRPAAFVFLSSSGVFAPGDVAEGLTDADHPTGASPYAAAKRAGEVLVPAALHSVASGSATPNRSVAVHVVRLGYLFGPGEVARPSRTSVSLVGRWLTAARGGQPLAVRSDDPTRDWTFAPDLAAALEKVVDGGSAGHTVHLGSPHVYTDSALATLIARQFPGTETVTVPAASPVKPPMVPSDIPALRGFHWTDPAAGLQALLAGEVVM